MRKKIISIVLTITMMMATMPVTRVFAGADDVVYFEDANLQAYINEEYFYQDAEDDITEERLAELGFLSLPPQLITTITSLEGLQYAVNLTDLDLGDNQISDITPLAGLTSLKYLYLSDNQISDITPLAGLTNLTHLSLAENQISDITSLAGLTNLTYLHLDNNQISNITALAGLTNLGLLSLSNNKISDIPALTGLTKLSSLSLADNQISDITALTGLTNLIFLNLRNNQITGISPLLSLTKINGNGCLSIDNNRLTQADIDLFPTIIANNANVSKITYTTAPYVPPAPTPIDVSKYVKIHSLRRDTNVTPYLKIYQKAMQAQPNADKNKQLKKLNKALEIIDGKPYVIKAGQSN